jgi:hypothetical protein
MSGDAALLLLAALASVYAVVAYWRRRVAAALTMVIGMGLFWLGVALVGMAPWETQSVSQSGHMAGIYMTKSSSGGYVSLLGLAVFSVSFAVFLVRRTKRW